MGLFRTLLRLLKLAQTTLLVLFLVAALSLNVATMAFSSVATLMASAYGAVTGTKAVLTKRNDQIDSLGKTVARKDKEIATLTDDVAKLKASRHVTYRGQKKLLSEAVEDTTGRVGKRIVANAGRNIGSMFGEAIPFVGIGVIVAATTWEIKDSCDTMRDLHELDVAFNPANAAQDGAQEVCGMRVPSKEEVKGVVVQSPGKAMQLAQDALPDLPTLAMPDIDWTPWN